MVCLHAADLSAFTMAIRVRISLSSLLDFFLGGIAPKRQVCPQATMCSNNKSLVQQYKCTRSALLSQQKTTFACFLTNKRPLRSTVRAVHSFLAEQSATEPAFPAQDRCMNLPRPPRLPGDTMGPRHASPNWLPTECPAGGIYAHT